MSVNSKMTAIADQIRELRGMSGSLSLNTMNTRLEEVRGYISDAFTAIGNKGGSLPGYQVSPNLATAINSIPDGVTVKKASGTITTDSQGSFHADCGFEPDSVILFEQTEQSYDSIVFLTSDVGFPGLQPSATVGQGVLKGICETFAENGMLGFYGNVWGWNWDWSKGTFMCNATYEYLAIKYIRG